jgi:hypothetical protein
MPPNGGPPEHRFAPGFDARRTGRPKGVRDKLSKKFLTDLLADYENGGKDAIKIMRIERPIEYVKVIASVLPKEFIFDTVESDLAAEQIDAVLELLAEPSPLLELEDGRKPERAGPREHVARTIGEDDRTTAAGTESGVEDAPASGEGAPGASG